MRRRVLLTCILLAASPSGCGKYRSPVPPEMLAPKEVVTLDVTATPGQVALKWDAPDKNRQGKELEFIDGYLIQRKEIAKRGDETNPDIEYVDLGFVKDTHVDVREKLRKEARAQGKIGRTVKAPDELMHFAYFDSTPQMGKTYLYQVVPQNQNGVDGVVKQVVKVIFKGSESDIIFITASDVDPTGQLENNAPVGAQ